MNEDTQENTSLSDGTLPGEGASTNINCSEPNILEISSNFSVSNILDSQTPSVRHHQTSLVSQTSPLIQIESPSQSIRADNPQALDQHQGDFITSIPYLRKKQRKKNTCSSEEDVEAENLQGTPSKPNDEDSLVSTLVSTDDAQPNFSEKPPVKTISLVLFDEQEISPGSHSQHKTPSIAQQRKGVQNFSHPFHRCQGRQEGSPKLGQPANPSAKKPRFFRRSVQSQQAVQCAHTEAIEQSLTCSTPVTKSPKETKSRPNNELKPNDKLSILNPSPRQGTPTRHSPRPIRQSVIRSMSEARSMKRESFFFQSRTPRFGNSHADHVHPRSSKPKKCVRQTERETEQNLGPSEGADTPARERIDEHHPRSASSATALDSDQPLASAPPSAALFSSFSQCSPTSRKVTPKSRFFSHVRQSEEQKAADQPPAKGAHGPPSPSCITATSTSTPTAIAPTPTSPSSYAPHSSLSSSVLATPIAASSSIPSARPSSALSPTAPPKQVSRRSSSPSVRRSSAKPDRRASAASSVLPSPEPPSPLGPPLPGRKRRQKAYPPLLERVKEDLERRAERLEQLKKEVRDTEDRRLRALTNDLTFIPKINPRTEAVLQQSIRFQAWAAHPRLLRKEEKEQEKVGERDGASHLRGEEEKAEAKKDSIGEQDQSLDLHSPPTGAPHIISSSLTPSFPPPLAASPPPFVQRLYTEDVANRIAHHLSLAQEVRRERDEAAPDCPFAPAINPYPPPPSPRPPFPAHAPTPGRVRAQQAWEEEEAQAAALQARRERALQVLIDADTSERRAARKESEARRVFELWAALLLACQGRHSRTVLQAYRRKREERRRGREGRPDPQSCASSDGETQDLSTGSASTAEHKPFLIGPHLLAFTMKETAKEMQAFVNSSSSVREEQDQNQEGTASAALPSPIRDGGYFDYLAVNLSFFDAESLLQLSDRTINLLMAIVNRQCPLFSLAFNVSLLEQAASSRASSQDRAGQTGEGPISADVLARLVRNIGRYQSVHHYIHTPAYAGKTNVISAKQAWELRPDSFPRPASPFKRCPVDFAEVAEQLQLSFASFRTHLSSLVGPGQPQFVADLPLFEPPSRQLDDKKAFWRKNNAQETPRTVPTSPRSPRNPSPRRTNPRLSLDFSSRKAVPTSRTPAQSPKRGRRPSPERGGKHRFSSHTPVSPRVSSSSPGRRPPCTSQSPSPVSGQSTSSHRSALSPPRSSPSSSPGKSRRLLSFSRDNALDVIPLLALPRHTPPLEDSTRSKKSRPRPSTAQHSRSRREKRVRTSISASRSPSAHERLSDNCLDKEEEIQKRGKQKEEGT